MDASGTEIGSNKWWINKIIAFEEDVETKDGTKLFQFAEEVFELKPFIFEKAPAAREKDISRIFRRLSAKVHPDQNAGELEKATKAMSTLSLFHEMILEQVKIENMTWDEFQKSEGSKRTEAENILIRAKETMDEEQALEETFADQALLLRKSIILKGLTGDRYIWNGTAVELMDYQKQPLRFKARMLDGLDGVVGYGRITKGTFDKRVSESQYVEWRGAIDAGVQSSHFWDNTRELDTIYAPAVWRTPAHDFSMEDMQEQRAKYEGTPDFHQFQTVMMTGYFLELGQQGKDVLSRPSVKMRVKSKHRLPATRGGHWYVAVVELFFPSEDYFIQLAANTTGDSIAPIKAQLQQAAKKVAALKDAEAMKFLKDAGGNSSASAADAKQERQNPEKSRGRTKGLELIAAAKPVPRRFPAGSWFRFKEKPHWLSLRVWPASGILRGRVQDYRRFPHDTEDTAFVELWDDQNRRMDGGLPEQIHVSKLEELGGLVEHSMEDNAKQVEKARIANQKMIAGYNPQFPPAAPARADPQVSQESVDTLAAMGLGVPEERLREVLKQAKGNVQLAANYLMSDKNML